MKDINKLLNGFPQISKKAEKEILEKVMPHYIFYKKTKNDMTAYCTHCKKEYTVSRKDKNSKKAEFLLSAKHNQEGTCLQCEKNTTFKSPGISRAGIVDFAQVNIIIPKNGAVYIKGCYIRHSLRDYKNAKISYSEAARYYFAPGQAYMWTGSIPFAYYHQSDYYECEERRWEHRKTVFEWENDYHIVNGQAIDKTFLKYSQLGSYIQFCDYGDKGGKNGYFQNSPAHCMKYLGLYTKHPCVEYLMKLGFKLLVWEKVNTGAGCISLNYKADTITGVFRGFTKQQINEICKISNTITAEKLNFIKMIIKNEKLTVEESEKMYELCQGQLHYLDEIIKLTGIKIRKAINYIEKAKKPKDSYSPMSTWLDYLRDCVKLNYDMKNEVVIMPKNLQKAHEKTILLIKYEKNKALDESMQKRAQFLKKYEFDSDGYLIIIPKSSKEIIDEGAKLNHCVGGYADRHAAGNTNILFIREQASPEKPFYTMEMDNEGRIRQIRGSKNKLPTEQINAFISKWEEKMKKPKKRKKSEKVA